MTIDSGQLLDWQLDKRGVQVYPAELDKGRGWLEQSCECPNCGFRWEAVAAVGSMGIECPACHETNLVYVWKADE